MDGIREYYIEWNKTDTEKEAPMLSFKCGSYKTWPDYGLLTSKSWEGGKAICGERDPGFDQWILRSCIQIVYSTALVCTINIS